MVSGNDAQNRQVHGAFSLHVDDLLMTGDDVFEKEIMGRLRKDVQVGSEDKNDCLFVGQRIQWKGDDNTSNFIADVRAINKTVRTIKSIPLSMRFWPNNEDESSQRAHAIFLAEEQDLRQGSSNSRGSSLSKIMGWSSEVSSFV